MNTKLNQRVLSTLCVAALLATASQCMAQSGGGQKPNEKLRKLETTQTGESRKLGKVVGNVAWLLEDLESNGLLEKAGGEKVKEFKEVVHHVADARLPAAAEHLRNARLEQDATRHHLATAEQEVNEIVSELAKVLAGSSGLLAEAELITELKDLIKVQTKVRGQTAEWGKALLINPKTAGAGKGPLMQDQTKIRTRYQTFLEKLQQIRADALDEASKSRLRQAENVLNPTPPMSENKKVQQILEAEPTTGDVLQAVVEQLDASDVLAAVGAQDRAIASFKTALQILSAGQFELADFVAGLEKLIEKQKILRKDTEAEEDLENTSSFYEARQVEIQDETTNYSFEAPDLFVNKKGDYLVEPLMISLAESVDALSAADKQKALPAQDQVIALLQSVYGTAKEAKEKQENGKDPFFAESPVVPEEMWKLPPDGDPEDAAMKDEDFPEIFEGILDAALMVQQEGTTEGSAPDVTTAAAANKVLGLEEREESSDPPDYVTDEGPPSAGGEAAEAPGENTEGDTSEVERDRLARDSMQRTRQKAKVQDYVRQLPPEFRRQVADYYELIAE